MTCCPLCTSADGPVWQDVRCGVAGARDEAGDPAARGADDRAVGPLGRLVRGSSRRAAPQGEKQKLLTNSDDQR